MQSGMSSDTLRIGFIGAGANTKSRHLPGFAKIPGVELAAVANRTLASAERVAEEFGVARAYGNWRELLEDESIDAVCIGTWPDTHAEITCAALAAGKHVLVEARMADSLAAAEAMQAAAKSHLGLVTQIVPSPFTLEADALIQQVVASGRLAKIQEIHSHWSNDATLNPDAPLHWRMDERVSGINTMALGICYEPLLRWIPGDPQVTNAIGDVVTPTRRAEDGSEKAIVIPERLEVEAKWDGAKLVMHQSSISPEPPRASYRISGTEGALDFDVLARRLEVTVAGGATERIEIPTKPDGGWAVEADFVGSIREGAAVQLTDFESGLRYMRFTHEVAIRSRPQE